MSRTTLIRRAATTAALVAGLVLTPLVAAPATAAELGSFSGVSSGFAVRVVVDAGGLLSAAPALAQALEEAGALENGVLDVTLLSTDGRADSQVAEATSTFLQGPPLLTGLVPGTNEVHATQANPRSSVGPRSFAIPGNVAGANLPILSGSLQELTAAVTPSPTAEGVGRLGPVTGSLDPVVSALPPEVTAALQEIVDELNATLESVREQVQQVRDEAEANGQPVAEAVDDLLGPLPTGTTVEDAVDQLLGAVDSTGDLVPNVPNPLDLLSDLLTVGAPTSNIDVVRDASGVTANATSSLGRLSVLGDVVTLDAVNMSAVTSATGSAGGASAAASCNALGLRVSDLDVLSLEEGVLSVGGVDLDVNQLTQPVRDAVNDVLGLVGVAVDAGELCRTTEEASPDGTRSSASAELAPISVSVGVPDAARSLFGGSETLVEVMIDPSVHSAVAVQPQIVPKTDTAPTSLPRTGAGVLGTVIPGALLAAGAFAIRRRMR